MANLDIIIKAIDQASGPLGGITKSLGKLDGASKFAQQGFGGLQKVVGGALLGGIGAVTAGVTTLGGVVATTSGRAAEFEQAMANVGAISLASADDLKKLEAAAMEAGSTTKFTATQAADGLAFLAMAGFNVEQSVAALSPVLSAAAAGNLDLATTADIVSNVIGGFRLEAEEAGRVADVLALTSANSNTSIEMLGQTMKFAAPTAANLGWSLEETAAAAGFLADAGIQSSLAGTHLRAIMGSLSTPTEAANKALSEMGVELRDGEGNMNSFTDIIAQFERGMASLGPAQKDFALNAIFGREAAGSFSILLGRGSEALDGYTDKLQGAGGAAKDMAERQLNTLQGQITLLQSALDGATVRIGQAFLPVLTDLAKMAIPAVEQGMAALEPFLVNLPGLIDSATDAIKGQIGNVYNAIDGFNEFKNQVIAIVQPIWDAVTAFVGWQDVLIAVGVVAASIVIPILGSIVAAAAPVIAVGLALVASIALVRKAWENDWGGIRTALTSWWDGTGKPIFEQLKTWLATNLPQALSTLKEWWDSKLLPAIRVVWSFIENNVIPIMAALADVWLAGVKVQLTLLGAAWENILKPALQALWNFITTYVAPALSSMVGGVEGISSAVSTAVGWLDRLAGWLTRVADKIGSMPSLNFGGIGSMLGFASGTPYAPGGMAYVHAGEMVSLPRGSRVHTANETAAMRRGGSGDTYVTMNVYGGNAQEIARTTENRLLDLQRRRGL